MIHLLWLSLLIPIILHLVHRRKAKVMPFSTLRFLRLIDQRVARRQRLKELLLLALRVLLLAALVGAVLKLPLRVGESSLPTTSALLLDNTASMRAVRQGGAAFARAQAAAGQALDGLKSGDSAAVELLQSPEGEASAPVSDLAAVRARVARMSCGYGSGDISSALRRCRRVLDGTRNPVKEVYIFSDFQRLAWPEHPGEATRDFPRDATVYLVDVGAELLRNLAVTHVDFSRKVAVAGAATHIEARIENTGRELVNSVAALWVEGARVAEKPVSVAPGGTVSILFDHVFREPGPCSGWIETGEDDLPADNRRFFAARVLDTLRVLLVNGEPSALPYRDGAFFLRAALQAGLQPNQLSPIRVEVVAPQDLASRDLSSYACAIFVNVARIEEDWPRRLAAYVQQGGGVLFFCGDRVDVASYNIHLARADAAGLSLLAGPLGEVRDARNREEGFFRIQRADAGHPVFRDIIRQVDLGSAQVNRFLSAGGEGGGDWTVLARLDEGPLLLEHRIGAGSVILCLTTCTPAWTNMPLKPWFLPVMHQAIYYVSRASGELLSGAAGEPFALPVRGVEKPVEVRFLPPPERSGVAASPVVVRSGLDAGENRAVFLGAERPGVYSAEYRAGTETRRAHFAVNVPPRESELARLTPQEARARLALPRCVVVKDPEQLAAAVRLERHGLPLWDYLLVLALAVAVLEVFVGNVFLKR